MAELTKEMVQRRLEAVASGTYAPEISGLPGIVFVKMGLKEKGISSRAYSSKLKELMAAGGYFSEALLPTVLEKACRENGVDPGILKKQREILKRFYDSIPPELAGPYDKLTDEEVAQLSPEEKADRDKAIEDRGRQIMEYMQNFYTEDDHKVMDQAQQIEALERHLKANTAEHMARVHQGLTEILICARRSDKIEEPFFASEEEIEEFGQRNHQGLVALFTKWKQFKEGLLPDFFYR